MSTAAERAPKSRRFFYVRVSILLFVLFVVVLYAVRDVRSRRERNVWDRTVDVAVVVLSVEGNAKVSDAALRGLEDHLAALEERFQAEAQRHHPGMPKPFHFRLFGPVSAPSPAPQAASDGFVDLVKQAIALRQWLGNIDPRAHVEPDLYDTRIYVNARRPATSATSFVEGSSQQGGRVGFVDVELDDSMVDLTLFVVGHELLHTLGASDKYDERGRARFPDGFAEPARTPLYPQRFAEIMARNRPITESGEAVPEKLDELAVGDATAREIGWVQ